MTVRRIHIRKGIYTLSGGAATISPAATGHSGLSWAAAMGQTCFLLGKIWDSMAMIRASQSHALVAAIALCTSFPATGTTLFPVERTCPIGGEKFQSVEIASTTQMGMRLDLRPLGPAGHLPWIECPNGFVVFKDEKTFTKEEISKLTAFIASDEYQHARTEHTTAYRAVLQRRALGEDDAALAFLILKAAWEAESPDFEKQHERYLREAYDAFTARSRGSSAHDEAWWTASLMLAEIERQRQHFRETTMLLDALPLSELAKDDVKRDVIAQIRKHTVAEDAKPAEFKRDRGAEQSSD